MNISHTCLKNFMRKRACKDNLWIQALYNKIDVAERRNRALLGMVRSMMAHAKLRISFWGDVLLMVVYILHHESSKSVCAIPCELWHERKPFLDHLRPWGSTSYVHNPTHRHGKLGPMATKMVFIRYQEHSNGHVMFGEYPSGGLTKVGFRNFVFLEDEFQVFVK